MLELSPHVSAYGIRGENLLKGGCYFRRCASSPCTNGGVCRDGQDSYLCVCLQGYAGAQCEIQDSCFSQPCAHDSMCEDSGGSEGAYLCTCRLGWMGENCEEEMLECDSYPCQNGATCVQGNEAYLCRCAVGFTAPQANCNEVNECISGPCQNGGECRDLTDAFTCGCTAGFSGELCEQTSYCASEPCQHGGGCREESDGHALYTCDCEDGWGLANCGTAVEVPAPAIDPCEPNPCQNHGSCSSVFGNDVLCSCLDGFSGELCEITAAQSGQTTAPEPELEPVPAVTVTVPVPEPEPEPPEPEPEPEPEMYLGSIVVDALITKGQFQHAISSLVLYRTASLDAIHGFLVEHVRQEVVTSVQLPGTAAQFRQTPRSHAELDFEDGVQAALNSLESAHVDVLSAEDGRRRRSRQLQSVGSDTSAAELFVQLEHEEEGQALATRRTLQGGSQVLIEYVVTSNCGRHSANSACDLQPMVDPDSWGGLLSHGMWGDRPRGLVVAGAPVCRKRKSVPSLWWLCTGSRPTIIS